MPKNSRTVLTGVLMFLCSCQYGYAAVTFASATQTGSVAENATVGTTVLTVTAATGGTGAVTYTLLTTSSEFAFDASSREITVKTGANLDHETTGSHNLTVQAVDTEPTTATVLITITVTDVNDAPMFAMMSGAHAICSSTAAGEVFATYTATDQDSGTPGTVTYSLNNADFSVSTAGAISLGTGNSFNVTARTAYVLTLTATDGGSLTDTMTIYVGVYTCGVGQLVGTFSLIGIGLLLIIQKYI